MAFTIKGFDLVKLMGQCNRLLTLLRRADKARTDCSPINEAINEGAKAINTPQPPLDSANPARMHHIPNPTIDRSRQLDKLRTTAKDLGIPESSKAVWFGDHAGKFDPLLLASQDANPNKRRNTRVSQANLTSTRLRALAESMEDHSDL